MVPTIAATRIRLRICTIPIYGACLAGKYGQALKVPRLQAHARTAARDVRRPDAAEAASCARGAHLHTYQGMVPKILTPVSTGRICLLPALNGLSGPPNQDLQGNSRTRKCHAMSHLISAAFLYVVLAACQAAERIVFRKSATLPFSDTACSCSAAATASAASAPASVSPATALTSTISRVTAAVPVAACSTLRAISPVAAPCCSTADAIALAISAISRTVASNWEIAVTVS